MRSLIERQVEALAHERHERAPDWTDEAQRKLARKEVRTEAVGAALRAAISLGYAESVEDDDGSVAEIEPAHGWEPYLRAIASGLCDDALPIRLRASELAQAVLSRLAEIGESELLVLLAIFDNERVDLIRWAGESEEIADLDLPGLTPATRTRLQRVFEARIPEQTGHRFRPKLDSDSGGNWTPIPEQSGQ